MSIFTRRRGHIDVEQHLGSEINDPTASIEVYDEVEGRVLIWNNQTDFEAWEATGAATWTSTRPPTDEDECPLQQLTA